jgi:hypothetical protein
MIDILEINKKVLARLSKLNSEKEGGNSNEQLIFPSKFQADGKKEIIRFSEQELRFLFVEEFKNKYPDLYYSIETPTFGKFNLGKKYITMKLENEGQSASHDMCIFQKVSKDYKRLLNIEFKYKNSGIMNTGKDILKLIREEQDGAFIHLLKNTNNGTLISVFKKLAQCFVDFSSVWKNEEKCIEITIMSLEQEKIIQCKLKKQDLNNLDNFFLLNNKIGSMNTFENLNWTLIDLRQ